MDITVPVLSYLVRKMLRHCQPISSTEVHEDIHHGRHHHVCATVLIGGAAFTEGQRLAKSCLFDPVTNTTNDVISVTQ